MNDISSTIDWDLVQLQYEVLHEAPNDIAEAYGVSVDVIMYAIESRGWDQKPYSESVGSWHDVATLENKTPDIVEALVNKATITQLLKIQNFNSRYVRLESLAISKLQSLITSIDETLPTATDQLKTAVQTLAALKEVSERRITGGTASADDELVQDKNVFNINVLSNSERLADGDKPAVQVQAAKLPN